MALKTIVDLCQSLIKPYINNKDKAIYEAMGSNGAKNRLKCSYYDVYVGGAYAGLKPATANGLALTYNDDGSIKVNGTPTDSSKNILIRLDFNNSNEADNDITSLAGEKIIASVSEETIAGIQFKPGYFDTSDNAHQIDHDIGVSGEYTFGSNAKYSRTYVTISAAYSYDNVMLYPMIRLASDSDPTYQPYAMTNRELTEIWLKTKFLSV